MKRATSNTFRHFWTKTLAVLSLAAMIGMLTACGSGTNTATTPQVFAQLRGTQERPTQVATVATGAATVTVTNSSSIHIDINTQNLVGVTSAEIRAGQPGTNGPVLFTLYTATGSSTFPASFHRDLTAADLTPQAGAGINTFADALNAITVTGNTYVNISTQANPTGELRGQIGAASFSVTPTGANVVPAVSTTATATATVQLNSKQSVLTVTVTGGQTLQGVSHIGVYMAQLGGNGPELFTVFDSGADGIFTGSVTRTLTVNDLKQVPNQTSTGILTFADAVNSLLSGNTYLLISTSAHTGGELRAQLISQ